MSFDVNKFFQNKKTCGPFLFITSNSVLIKLWRRIWALGLIINNKLTIRNYLNSFKTGHQKFKLHEIQFDYLPKIYRSKHYIFYNHRFDVNEMRPYHALLFFRDIFYFDQYHIKDFIKSDSVVVDAGAHYGMFSVMAANLAREGKVYSFEPSKNNFTILKKNTKYYKNIFINNKGLSDQSKIDKIHLTSRSECNYIKGNFQPLDDLKIIGKEKIVLNELDDFVSKKKLVKLDFIKIDTEGFEKQIISGAKKTIRKFQPIIAVSAYHFAEDREKIVNLVLKIDPTYQYKISDRGELDIIFFHEPFEQLD